MLRKFIKITPGRLKHRALLRYSPLMLSLLLVVGENFASEEKLSFKERLKAKAAQLAYKARFPVKALTSKKAQIVYDALLLGIQYGKQAKLDEQRGYEYAHQKAAYDWGYEVGDPVLIKTIRFYWEGIQLGVFAIGDIQERSGEKSPKLATLESLVGGNGKEYTVNKAYIDDIFDDVKIATDGAKNAENGTPNDFDSYKDKHLK